MPSFNQVILMGNLTRDPQLKYLPNQTPVVEFGIAVNRKFKGQGGEEREDVTFVDCAAFAKTAELINQYFTKGKPIFVQGRLKFDSWDDKQSGVKRSRLTVVVESFQFVGGREQQDEQPAERPAPANIAQGVRQKVENRSEPEYPFPATQQFKEADIPF